MRSSEIYVKLLRWGIFVSLFLPLIIFSQYLSPFHFGKMVIFRSLVEIMAVIYILLILSTGKRYLPKWTPIVITFTIFTGLYALCSFTAIDFNYAFWGTLERMGGLFSFLHFWVFFIILVSVFGKNNTNDTNYNANATNYNTNDTNNANRDWMKLLKLCVVVGFLSILFAYGQHFKLGNFFVGWQHEGRVIGTIGNAALFAGYLLFVLFLSIYFLIKANTNPEGSLSHPAGLQPGADGKRSYGASATNDANKKKRWRWFCAVVLVLGIPILLMTAVRGSIIAFFGGLFLLGLIYLISPASAKATADRPASPCLAGRQAADRLKNRKVKLCILIALIIFLIFAGFVWSSRDKAWVKNIGWLNRITTISLKTTTLQTRLWSWHSGWQGFKEKPILGWGPENFVLAHAKYFDPRHFKGMGSETIWDRAHNIVLEMLTTMGIVGLLSYLSIFAAVFWLLIKRFTPLEIKRDEGAGEIKTSLTGFKQKRIDLTTPAVFGVMLTAYFVHNLFIFDTMANYFMFFLVLGYINFVSRRNTQIDSEQSSKHADTRGNNYQRESAYSSEARPDRRGSAIVIFILVVGAVILIYKTNIEPVMANYACTRAILLGRAGSSQKAFDKYQEALSYKTYQGKYEIRHRLATFSIQYNEILYKKGKEINRELIDYTIEEEKKTIKAHPQDYVPYMYLARNYILLIKEEPKWAGEKAKESIMNSLAINDRNPRVWYELGQAEFSQKKYNEANESFKKALELNPDVKESLWFLGISYSQLGNIEQALEYVEKAIEKGYNYENSFSNIVRLINIYAKAGDYYKVIDLYKLSLFFSDSIKCTNK